MHYTSIQFLIFSENLLLLSFFYILDLIFLGFLRKMQILFFFMYYCTSIIVVCENNKTWLFPCITLQFYYCDFVKPITTNFYMYLTSFSMVLWKEYKLCFFPRIRVLFWWFCENNKRLDFSMYNSIFLVTWSS